MKRCNIAGKAVEEVAREIVYSVNSNVPKPG